MRKMCVTIVVLLTMVAFNGSTLRSAESGMLQEDPNGKLNKSGKEKGEPDSRVSGALGTKTNPVRCRMPSGERKYLSRLRCADGNAPEFSRIGSFGGGAYGNIIDGYRVICGGDTTVVFMDMYHAGYVEKEPVPGFTIVE